MADDRVEGLPRPSKGESIHDYFNRVSTVESWETLVKLVTNDVLREYFGDEDNTEEFIQRLFKKQKTSAVLLKVVEREKRTLKLKGEEHKKKMAFKRHKGLPEDDLDVDSDNSAWEFDDGDESDDGGEIFAEPKYESGESIDERARDGNQRRRHSGIAAGK